MRTRFLINFGGFYDSIHSNNIDWKIESEPYISDEDIDWAKTKDEYCREYINQLNNELDITLNFEELWSPKFYNFESDKIDASIDDKEWKRWKQELLKDKELKEYIEENSKSRDGFTSFYSGWENVIAEDEIFLQYVFDYLLSKDDNELENTILQSHEFELVFKDELPKEWTTIINLANKLHNDD